MRKKNGIPPNCGICNKHRALYEAPIEHDGPWINICKQCSTFFTIPQYANEYVSNVHSGRVSTVNMFGKREVNCPKCDAIKMVDNEKQYTCECGIKVKV